MPKRQSRKTKSRKGRLGGIESEEEKRSGKPEKQSREQEKSNRKNRKMERKKQNQGKKTDEFKTEEK